MTPPRRRKPSKRGGSRRRPAAPVDFWGKAPTDDGSDVESIRPADDPTALVLSLGPPPLPGREMLAEHYFATVYDKACSLATALAAAAALLPEPEDGDGA
jgi:hypothetical protein